MTTYSVADAKAALPRLINCAAAGEQVVITRHGTPVAEIRAIGVAPAISKTELHEWMASRRLTPKGAPMTSVELLNLVYDDPDG